MLKQPANVTNKAISPLNGVTVDYVSSMQGSGFTFTNPNATGGCGCGSSFTA
jgi:iron-sulfur cluster assembly protein